MTRPRPGAVFLIAVQFEQLVRSPLTPGCPVHSCQVGPAASAVLAPLVTDQLGSDTKVVPATMQAKTRSLPTDGVALWRRNTPAACAVTVAQAVTAKYSVDEPLP